MFTQVDNVLDKSSKGWLKVNVRGYGKAYLCYKTKIKIKNNKNEKKQFEVLDGIFRGQEISFYNKKDLSCLQPIKKTTSKPSSLYIDLAKSTLTINGLGSFKIVIEKKDIFPGKYEVLIPSNPHFKKTSINYIQEESGGSRFAETWFELLPTFKKREGQFLHFGIYSEGCITLPFEKKQNAGANWTAIYLKIIGSRIGNSSIGMLTVR